MAPTNTETCFFVIAVSSLNNQVREIHAFPPIGKKVHRKSELLKKLDKAVLTTHLCLKKKYPQHHEVFIIITRGNNGLDVLKNTFPLLSGWDKAGQHNHQLF